MYLLFIAPFLKIDDLPLLKNVITVLLKEFCISNYSYQHENQAGGRK